MKSPEEIVGGWVLVNGLSRRGYEEGLCRESMLAVLEAVVERIGDDPVMQGLDHAHWNLVALSEWATAEKAKLERDK